MDVTPIPKRPRIVNRKAQPFDGTPLAQSFCPICRQYGAKLNRAHVVPKGLYGDDVPENLAWICGDGVMGCHGLLTHGNRVIGHPIDAREARHRFVIYCRLAVPELGVYADGIKGAGWLETYYLGDERQEAA
jgi:hypothetical protein